MGLCLWLAAAGLAAAQRVGDVAPLRVNDAVPAAVSDVRWCPPVTDGLVLHLAADTMVGRNQGDLIEQWNDLSGTGNHVSQATPANRPTYQTDALNGLPVVRFDGNNDVLSTSANLDLTAGYTIFAVTRNRARKNWNGIIGVMDNLATANSDLELYWQAGTTDAGSGHLVLARDRNGGAFRFFPAQNAPPAVGQFCVVTARGASHEGKLWTDGVARASSDLDYRPPAASPAHVGIGYYQAFLDGDIAEILVYDRALSDPERQAVESYLNEKWLDG